MCRLFRSSCKDKVPSQNRYRTMRDELSSGFTLTERLERSGAGPGQVLYSLAAAVTGGLIRCGAWIHSSVLDGTASHHRGSLFEHHAPAH